MNLCSGMGVRDTYMYTWSVLYTQVTENVISTAVDLFCLSVVSVGKKGSEGEKESFGPPP